MSSYSTIVHVRRSYLSTRYDDLNWFEHIIRHDLIIFFQNNIRYNAYYLTSRSCYLHYSAVRSEETISAPIFSLGEQYHYLHGTIEVSVSWQLQTAPNVILFFFLRDDCLWSKFTKFAIVVLERLNHCHLVSLYTKHCNALLHYKSAHGYSQFVWLRLNKELPPFHSTAQKESIFTVGKTHLITTAKWYALRGCGYIRKAEFNTCLCPHVTSWFN